MAAPRGIGFVLSAALCLVLMFSPGRRWERMTDKQLVKALRCCANDDCSHCPAEPERNEVYPRCDAEILREAADRIEKTSDTVVYCKSCWMFNRCVITPMLGENGFCSEWEAVRKDG